MFRQIKEAAAAVVASPAWRAALGTAAPIWSFDNDAIHQNPTTLASLQINTRNRFPLPPNSPDMHRVIERVVGRVKAAYAAWLHDHPTPRSPAGYQAALLALFRQTQTAAVISKDVANLPALWPSIIKNKGDWASTDQL